MVSRIGERLKHCTTTVNFNGLSGLEKVAVGVICLSILILIVAAIAKIALPRGITFALTGTTLVPALYLFYTRALAPCCAGRSSSRTAPAAPTPSAPPPDHPTPYTPATYPSPSATAAPILTGVPIVDRAIHGFGQLL